MLQIFHWRIYDCIKCSRERVEVLIDKFKRKDRYTFVENQVRYGQIILDYVLDSSWFFSDM